MPTCKLPKRPLYFLLLRSLNFSREGARDAGGPTPPLEEARGRACVHGPCPAELALIKEWSETKQNSFLLEKAMPGFFISHKQSIMPVYSSAKAGLSISPVLWAFISQSLAPPETVNLHTVRENLWELNSEHRRHRFSPPGADSLVGQRHKQM